MNEYIRFLVSYYYSSLFFVWESYSDFFFWSLEFEWDGSKPLKERGKRVPVADRYATQSIIRIHEEKRGSKRSERHSWKKRRREGRKSRYLETQVDLHIFSSIFFPMEGLQRKREGEWWLLEGLRERGQMEEDDSMEIQQQEERRNRFQTKQESLRGSWGDDNIERVHHRRNLQSSNQHRNDFINLHTRHPSNDRQGWVHNTRDCRTKSKRKRRMKKKDERDEVNLEGWQVWTKIFGYRKQSQS